MEQGFNEENNTNTTNLITNIESATTNTEYVITRNDENEIVINELIPEIENLNNIQQGNRYQLTRNNNRVQPIQNTGIEIPTPSTGDLSYAVRRNGNNYFLTRTPVVYIWGFWVSYLSQNCPHLPSFFFLN